MKALPSFLVRQLERLGDRQKDLERLLADPEVMMDAKAFRSLSREHADAAPKIARFSRLLQIEKEAQDAAQITKDFRLEPEMVALANAEIAQLHNEQTELTDLLQHALLPKDPDDFRNAFLEIRAGTGGDESTLFAGSLLRMYCRFADAQGWKVDILNESPSELGGYKEVVLQISGDGVYGLLKYESGGHRVQRVPTTETQGRIHTSACTVAVLAEPDESVALTLNPSELRIDTFRASGAGGQHVNKTDSAVRITHLPTGIVAECQDDRSQHRNKAKAMQVLEARIADREKQEKNAQDALLRRELIGNGDRSDRIRTYNFPQGRLTDHRINLTLYKLLNIMEGDLMDVLVALRQAAEAKQLEQFQSQSGE